MLINDINASNISMAVAIEAHLLETYGLGFKLLSAAGSDASAR